MDGLFGCNVVDKIPKEYFTKKKQPEDFLREQLMQAAIKKQMSKFTDDLKEGGAEYEK